MKALSIKSKALFAAFALVFGLLSCEKENGTTDDPDANTDDPENVDDSGNSSGTDSSSCTFDLVITSVTQTSVSYTVAPSLSTVDYYVTVLEKNVYGSADEQGLIDAVTEQVTLEATENGSALEDYLAQVLQSGVNSGTIDGLDEDTDYLLVALGLSSDGTATTQPGYVEFSTEADPNKLTFTLSYSNLTETSVDLRTVPSDPDAEYISLCQAASAYPGLDGSDPNAIAESYISGYGSWYDAGIGLLYQGELAVTGFSLVKDTKYYFFAFGYTRGVGITSDCELVIFTSSQGTLPQDFEANISVTSVSSTTIGFTVTPSSGHESTYYGVVVLPTSEYTDDTAKSEVEADILYEYNMQIEMGFPNFSMADAVSNVCSIGTNSFTASELTSGTDYTIAVVAVDSQGNAAAVVTQTAQTS